MSNRIPTQAIDHGFAFANNLFLIGWTYPKSEPISVSFIDRQQRRTHAQIAAFRNTSRPDVRSAILHASPTDDDRFGFVAVVELADLIGYDLHSDQLDVAVKMQDGSVASGALRIQTAVADQRNGANFHDLLELAAGFGLLDYKLVNFVKGSGARQAEFATKYAIDAACKSNSGFIMEGWVENARSKKLSFLSNDGLSFVAASEVIFKARPDVSEYLRAEKCPVLTEDHGVVLNFPQCASETNGLLVLTEDRDTFASLAQITVEFSQDRGRLLQIASQTGGGRLPSPPQAKKLFRPFFVETETSAEYSTIPIKTVPSHPKIAIIVPFYGEYRFIFSLLTMQKRFSSEFEWIFVSDEPAKHQLLTQILEKRSDSLNCSTTLVLNRSNYGYSRSNNIAAAVARADILLFMNSDIWVDTARPIVNAAKALDAEKFQIVGFRLLFEDGTIQHEGMSFKRSGFVHDLFVVDHPGKGTPPDQDWGKIIEVPAVTGALLMIKKDMFLKVGQFDRAYIKGDFEDADLCLKVRSNRGRVGLYKTDGLYHLERQSIRLMDNGSARMALTYLNCITFNERWAKYIAPRDAAPEISPLMVSGRGRREKVEA